MCCQYFLFDASDWQYTTSKCDLACHGDAAVYGALRQCRDNRCGHRDACGRTIFRNCSGGQVQMNMIFRIETIIEAELLRACSCIRECGLGRLFHDIAKLPCKHKMSATLHK